MNFSTDQIRNVTFVTSNVEKLDASNAPELKSHFFLLNNAGINNIILDLSSSKYCDSSGLSAILTGNRLCKDTNGKFVICGLQSNAQKMIEIAQLDRVFKICDTVEEAQAAVEF